MEVELSLHRLARRPRIAVLAAGSPTGELGGAERFYVGLRDALERAGAEVDLRSEFSHEADIFSIKQTYLRFYDINLTTYDGVISTKAPSYMVRHRNHVCYLLHTIRAFYDMFGWEFPDTNGELLADRRLIHALDTAALHEPRTRKVFVIGHEVRERLQQFNGIGSEVLYPNTSLSGLRGGAFKHLLLPGRLHRWKRVDLVIEAMRHVRTDLELVITGTGEDESWMRRLAAPDDRIRFSGRVSDSVLAALYADAFAVVFVPRSEDLGYVTIEAFLSAKPVITCSDAGEPARLVQHDVSGLVVAPEPVALAQAIERLARNRGVAEAMGSHGKQSIGHISWDYVASRLLSALGCAGRDAAASL
jgi:glycosyltransferase involved in cell wall biosynthesis